MQKTGASKNLHGIALNFFKPLWAVSHANSHILSGFKKWWGVVSIQDQKKRSAVYMIFIIQCPLSTLFHRRSKVIHPSETTLFGSGRSRTVRATGARREVASAAATAAVAPAHGIWRERDFQGQNTTMLLASGGAPHHDFHSECTMSNDDKGNAKDCIHS
jgi:hypothetical protein